jgi:hypothetical protein
MKVISINNNYQNQYSTKQAPANPNFNAKLNLAKRGVYSPLHYIISAFSNHNPDMSNTNHRKLLGFLLENRREIDSIKWQGSPDVQPEITFEPIIDDLERIKKDSITIAHKLNINLTGFIVSSRIPGRADLLDGREIVSNPLDNMEEFGRRIIDAIQKATDKITNAAPPDDVEKLERELAT